MASLLWTKNSKSNSRAPSTIFSTSSSNLSPRQVANKAYSLAIKKLDRDDKRSRPHYNVRERLLLCNTLSRAEQFLQKRTARTNRRVMAFEDEDVCGSKEEERRAPAEPVVVDHHSPLCHMEEDEEDDEETDDDDEPSTPEENPLNMALASKSLSPMGTNAFVIPQDDEDFLQHYPSSFLIPNSTPHHPIASIL